MSIIRSVTVSASSNSSVMGIPAQKDKVCTYVSAYPTSEGEQLDVYLNANDPVVYVYDENNILVKCDSLKQYQDVVVFEDKDDNKNYRVALTFKDGQLAVVGDKHGLVWTNDNLSSKELVGGNLSLIADEETVKRYMYPSRSSD